MDLNADMYTCLSGNRHTRLALFYFLRTYFVQVGEPIGMGAEHYPMPSEGMVPLMIFSNARLMYSAACGYAVRCAHNQSNNERHEEEATAHTSV